MLSSEYKEPKAIEMVIAAFTQYARHEERLYMDGKSMTSLVGKSVTTYSRCEELVGDQYRVVVGGFGSGGLYCGYFCHNLDDRASESFGVVVSRKF